MSKARTNKKWPEFQEFMNANKNLLVMIADPVTDEVCISFQGLNGFMRFPSKDMFDGVVFNALRQSKFDEAIGPFMSGVVECSGIDVSTKEGNEFLEKLGSTMRAIGRTKAQERSKLEVLPKRSKKKK